MQTVLITGGATNAPGSGSVGCNGQNSPAMSYGRVITACAELYDPVTDTFTAVGPMSVGRVAHTATLIDSIRITCPDGLPCILPTSLRVLIAGGSDGSQALASLEFYDFYNRIFKPVQTCTSPTTTSALSTARTYHTATWLPTVAQILIAGGTANPSSGQPLSTAEIFDPACNSLLPPKNLLTPRFNHTATLLTRGYYVLLAGGLWHVLSYSRLGRDI